MNLLDAIAEYALTCYYREANIATANRSDDDAHGLLNGYNGPHCWVGEAEANNHTMGDTRTACMAWVGISTEFDGFSAFDIATAYAEMSAMLTDAEALAELQQIVESERDTWHAIANRWDSDADDADALAEWEETVAIVDKRITDRADTMDRLAAYCERAMTTAKGVVMDRRCKRVHYATVGEETIIDLARAVEATMTKGL